MVAISLMMLKGKQQMNNENQRYRVCKLCPVLRASGVEGSGVVVKYNAYQARWAMCPAVRLCLLRGVPFSYVHGGAVWSDSDT